MRVLASLAIGIVMLLSPVSAPVSGMSDGHAMPEWMTGTWAHKDGEDWAEEYWSPLRADIMFGASRSGTGYTLNFWEQMRIQRQDDNAVVLWVISADQKPVRFEAKVSGKNTITFENPEHDYPQSIHYWREGKKLKAEISLLDGTKPVHFEFLRVAD
jgi:hypothetical protein